MLQDIAYEAGRIILDLHQLDVAAKGESDFVTQADMGVHDLLHKKLPQLLPGKSRTAIFMEIYDMMKNPDVPFEDIMLRHAMTGSSYIPYADPESDIAEVYAKRAKRIRQIYEYLQEMDGSYTTPWSEWIADREADS